MEIEDFSYWSEFCRKSLQSNSLKCYFYGAGKLIDILRAEKRYCDELRLRATVYYMKINQTQELEKEAEEVEIAECFSKTGLKKSEAVEIIKNAIGDYVVPECLINSTDVIDVFSKILSGRYSLAKNMTNTLLHDKIFHRRKTKRSSKILSQEPQGMPKRLS